jgi:hypothetical protein
MQSPMFVFAGFQSSSNDTLSILFERLNKIFSEKQIPVLLTKKDKLLTSRFEDASFYITILTTKMKLKIGTKWLTTLS